MKCWVVMWLDSNVRPLVQGQVPKGLESKTTLVIQMLDLGFIMSVAFLSGILLHRRAPLGYLLASTVLIKSFTLGTVVSAMVGGTAGRVSLSIGEIVGFLILTLIGIGMTIVLLRNVSDAATLQVAHA